MDGGSKKDCYSLSVNSLIPKIYITIWIEPKLNGKKIRMELDTGSAVSVMPLDMFQKYLCDVELKPTNTILKTYTRESVKPMGQAQIHVKLQKQKKIQLFVVQEGKNALLGRSWLKNLKLNWVEIKALKLKMKLTIQMVTV